MRDASMRPAIIDTGIGNFGSIVSAFRRVGGDPFIARDAAELEGATHLVLPGVGSFDAALRTIDETGLRPRLTELVLAERIPLLGICLGMQILGTSSEEGRMPGLGWLPGRSMRFRPPPEEVELRVPHIGWNRVETKRRSDLLAKLGDHPRFYYVHSYHYVDEGDGANTLAVSHYGYAFAAIIQRGNIVGTQFHPERSSTDGLQLMRNFLDMRSPRVRSAVSL